MAKQRGNPSSHPSTAVLTRGFDPRLSVGSARPAVFRSSTYVFHTPEAAERAFDLVSGRKDVEPGEVPDLIYSRFNHPNAEILEDQIVPLEEGSEWAVVFNSGMAAIMTSLMALLRPGDCMLYTVPLYGGTQNLIHELLEPFGIECRPVVAGHAADLDAAIRSTPNLKVILIETPANPTMVMTDIKRACILAGDLSSKPVVMVDNTFLGPTFQHPMTLGADLVLYSATKYLGGFSDLLAGVALGADPEIQKKLRAKRGLFGNILQPDECWILDGRLPTVSLRMNRQSKNAQRIAESLVNRKEIRKVYYPTLFDDPEQIRVRLSQCDYPGAMIALELQGGKPAAFEFLRHLELAHNAVSLGGMETLVCHPGSTTHSGCSEEERRIAGITGGLVRISVGVEDWRDLLRDFEQALDHIAATVLT
ncbi:aminotransferase class I/II-fold pyridoxal phosphate-dependent enzyme [uncultured Paludibaculum sp.]|uniref:trans-sulfuration enzyme family protein n=1 Tax=uncultured Paludibaculum sp. TaxID=1765020 RepID=UPI002AAC2301|nr:aminotransferase class I/II-fold pyridoxal phosphate-dependent enzyme [uncultured Paludibaculum sp.]